MLAVVGGMALLVVASMYHPQIERAVRSVWSRIHSPGVHNETTSTDSPQTASALPRTLFTASQQNLKSKSVTSNRLDRRDISQVDQIIASITGFNSSSVASSPVPALPAAKNSSPAISSPLAALPTAKSSNPALSSPVVKTPSAPAACSLTAPFYYRSEPPPELNSFNNDIVKSSTSVECHRQPEVTSLFSGNPCAPPITTFAPSTHEYTFSLSNPPATNRDADLPPQTVDVNELVAALAANPKLKRPCQDSPKAMESAHVIEMPQKSATAVAPVTVPVEKHVSISLAADKVMELSSSVLQSMCSVTAQSADPLQDGLDKNFNPVSPPQRDQDSIFSTENKKMPSTTTFTSAETDLSFDSVKMECQRQQSVHETTSALRLQAPVPPIASNDRDLVSKSATSQHRDLASKSATSQRSRTKIERKHTY